MAYNGGYRGYINVSDGQHSVSVNEPSEVIIKQGKATIRVYTAHAGVKSSYHGSRCPVIMGHKTTIGRKVVDEERYGVFGNGFHRTPEVYIPYSDKSWTGRNGEIVRRGSKVFGVKGVCRTRYSRGRLLGQSFYYSNGARAYRFNSKQSDCVVRYPNGKVAFEWIGKVPLSSVFSSAYANRDGYPCFGNAENTNANIDSVDHKFREYDRRGRLKEKGEFSNRQQVGEWVVNYKEQYFANGIMVDKALYEAKPEDIEPSRVLNEPNAQFRAMLLKKIGLERLVKTGKGKLIDKTKEGYELYDFNTKGNGDTLDKVLRVLKVVCPSTKTEYFLRIPADKHFDTCYKAREGTFNEFDIDATERIAFALET